MREIYYFQMWCLLNSYSRQHKKKKHYQYPSWDQLLYDCRFIVCRRISIFTKCTHTHTDTHLKSQWKREKRLQNRNKPHLSKFSMLTHKCPHSIFNVQRVFVWACVCLNENLITSGLQTAEFFTDVFHSIYWFIQRVVLYTLRLRIHMHTYVHKPSI